MKVGDRVRKRIGVDTRHEPWKSLGLMTTGLVMRIDKDFFGADTAFKTHPAHRGEAVRDCRRPDFIAKTSRGIRDRVLILWANNWTYEESPALEVIDD